MQTVMKPNLYASLDMIPEIPDERMGQIQLGLENRAPKTVFYITNYVKNGPK